MRAPQNRQIREAVDTEVRESEDGWLFTHCAPQEEIEARMQCTCRCEAPDPETEVCSCSEAQTCTPLIFTGPLAGSYCVNSEIL